MELRCNVLMRLEDLLNLRKPPVHGREHLSQLVDGHIVVGDALLDRSHFVVCVSGVLLIIFNKLRAF